MGDGQLIKLFRRARPADLTAQQPPRFELLINLQTAKAIGDEIPARPLRANKVIE